MSNQPKPTGEQSGPVCLTRKCEFANHPAQGDFEWHYCSTCNTNHPFPRPKPTGEQAIAMTRVCLWRLREEVKSIEEAHGGDAVPAYLRRCIHHLSIFENKAAEESGEWTAERLINAIGWNPDSRCFEKVANDINAALAAKERDYKIACTMRDNYGKGLDVAKQQLAAERERVDGANGR